MPFAMPVRSLTSRVLKWPDAQSVHLAVREWARRVARESSDVVRIGYFGSYARGNWGVGSDVDLVIIVRGSELPFERRATAWDATRLPVPADVVVYTEEEWERLTVQGGFCGSVMREAVWVYPDAKPEVVIEPVSRQSGPDPGQWVFGWDVRNVGQAPLTLLQAWQPHGHFRGPRTGLTAHPEIPPGATGRVDLPVACDEPPGTVVENAFLILNAEWRRDAWRILARLRITADASGAPDPTTEDISVQRIGFSREGSRIDEPIADSP